MSVGMRASLATGNSASGQHGQLLDDAVDCIGGVNAVPLLPRREDCPAHRSCAVWDESLPGRSTSSGGRDAKPRAGAQ